METERKTIQTLTVAASESLAPDVYSLFLQYPEGAFPDIIRPGQFVGLYTGDTSMLLPRPISICGWDRGRRLLRLVYRVAGKGTALFAGLRPGDTVDVLGILGNGYDVSLLAGGTVLLIGGGIGIPPMLGLAQALLQENERILSAGSSGEEMTGEYDRMATKLRGPQRAGNVVSVMGYRTDELFLADEFSACGELIVATDDGSAGFHGNAPDAARREVLLKDTSARINAICACGPLPMLRGVKALAVNCGIPAYLSLEERMACGVGACLGCVTGTMEMDGHSHVHNARVCTEGPVFEARTVEL